MSLANKTLLILSLMVVSLTAVVYEATRVLLLPRFLEGERHEAQSALERAQSLVEDEISELAATTNDYGAWDRTYEFMVKRSPEYSRIEYENATLQGLRLNSVTLIDNDGKVVYTKTYDTLRMQDAGSAGKLGNILAGHVWVKHILNSAAVGSGIVLLPQGPALVAASPILTSDRRGPSRGVLLMTRNLDQSVVAGLQGELHSELTTWLISNPLLPADFHAVLPDLEGNVHGTVVRPKDQNVIAGYKFLLDVEGKPALLLRVSQPRHFLRQGLTSLRYLLGGLCVAGVVFICVTMVLLHYAVLERVTSLNAQIRGIGERRNLAERITVSGSDELSKLGEAVNIMLKAIHRSDDQFRVIAENIHQALWVRYEVSNEIAYINPPAEALWGLSREKWYAEPELLLEVVQPEDRSVVEEMLARQGMGKEGDAEFRIKRPDGSIRWVWRRHFPVFDADGKLKQTVGMTEDVTEYKTAEETLLKSQEELWNVMLASHGSAATLP